MGAQLRLDLNAIMEMAGTLSDVLPLEILPETDREELARQMRVRNFRSGEVIYHRGDPGDQANVVFSGLVKVMLLNDDGHEALVALHGRGEFFGELALFTEAPRDASVIAILPTTVLQITREAMWRVLDRNPKAREWMFRHLGRTIQRLGDKYESIVFLDVPARLAKYLLELDASAAELPITQDDIAAAIGSTRVTVNKLLGDLERRGAVAVDRRKIAVRDRAALERELQR
jgi:CRP-like cAMP-binding protein